VPEMTKTIGYSLSGTCWPKSLLFRNFRRNIRTLKKGHGLHDACEIKIDNNTDIDNNHL